MPRELHGGTVQGNVAARHVVVCPFGTGKTRRERPRDACLSVVPAGATARNTVNVTGYRDRIGKIWSSEKGSMVDALELLYDEGRGKLREAAGRSTHPEIRG